MLFLERSDGRNRNDALDAELLEAMNVGAEIEFAGQEAVAASVARQKSDLAAFERAADVGVGRRAERRLHPHFLDLGQAGHGIEPAAADDSDFRLWQSPSRTLAMR